MEKSLIAPFREEHDLLAEIAGQIRKFVTQPEPSDAVELFHLRMHFSRKLIAHLHSEDWTLYTLLRASKDKETAALADRFSKEMGQLSVRYLAYARRWTTTAAGADWPGFCEATIEMLDALAERIERENNQLYPRAERECMVDIKHPKAA